MPDAFSKPAVVRTRGTVRGPTADGGQQLPEPGARHPGRGRKSPCLSSQHFSSLGLSAPMEMEQS